MDVRKILNQINILGECKRQGLSLWQCPSFLVLVMGIIIIGSTLITYLVGNRYIDNPELIALITLLITLILFIIAATVIHSFEKLAEISRMKSEFVRIVSHQLRSPLSNLKWAIEMLMSGRLGKIEERQIEYFKILKENSALMEGLTKNLITVSKIETANLVLKKTETSLKDLIEKVISEYQPVIRASNIEIEFKTGGVLPKVFVDQDQIKLVIENLLDNAIRYIKDKGKIEISLVKKDQNLYFEIKDNGVGIPKEDQKYIFQKFFRAGNILRYQTGGSGLGLYIARSIIKISGGKIGFRSEENKGSTFWFTLPIK